MTSSFKHFEGIAQSRFHKHRSGLRRSPSIYRPFEIGNSVEKAFGAEAIGDQPVRRDNGSTPSTKNLLELKGIGY
jgi:hypothetical protein